MKKSIGKSILSFVCLFFAIVLFGCYPVSETPLWTPVSTSPITPAGSTPLVADTATPSLPTAAPLVSMDLKLVREELTSATAMIWLSGDRLAVAQSKSISLIGLPASNQALSAASEVQSAGDVQNPIFLTTSLAATDLAWVANEHIVQYWNYSQSSAPLRLADSKAPVTSLAVAADGGQIVYATSTGDVIQIATNNPEDAQTWQAPAWLSDLSYSPDGQSIGGIDLPNNTAYVFSLDGKVQKKLEYTNLTGLPLSGGYFCPNWSQISWVSGSFVQIMDLKTGGNGLALNHADAVSAIAWSPDCRLLATASAIMQGEAPVPVLYLWDLSKEGAQTTFPQPAAIQSISFSPDGKQIAVMDTAGRVRIYQLPQ